jgi:hypothetical protein
MQRSNPIVWVEEFDEDDWMQLLNADFVEEYEDGKAFLRAN